MTGKNSFLWLGLVLAAGGLGYWLARGGLQQPEVQPAARGTTTRGEQRTNQNPMKQMMQSMMSGVVTPGIQPEHLPEPNSEGAQLAAKYCAQCHNLPSPLMHAADEWPGIAERMFLRMSMCSQMGGMGMTGMMGMMEMKAPSTNEQEAIVAYLKKHSLVSIRPDAIPSPRTEGALLFAATCTQCHALPDPQLHTAQEWPAVVSQMQSFMESAGKTRVTEGQRQKITDYLEEHAKR